jgi:hypothetical protein
MGLLLLVAMGITAGAYWLGRTSGEREASAYLFDVGTHLTLSCSNEHVVMLTELREGRIDEAIRGLELLVTAKLENIDTTKLPNTTIARKSLDDLRVPLVAYQTKYPATTLDPKKNPRLNSVMQAPR